MLEEARKLAHVRTGVELQTQPTQRSFPLLPITAHTEWPRNPLGVHQHLLYKLGGAVWDPAAAANRLVWAKGWQEKDESAVSEAFKEATAPFKRHALAAEAGHRLILERRARIKVYVRRRDQVLRDEVDFNLGAHGGCGHALAADLQQYAASVCSDLNLGQGWFSAVVKSVGLYISEDLRNDLHQQALQPLELASLVCLEPSQYPCLTEVDPELDALEQERTRRREEKVVQRKGRAGLPTTPAGVATPPASTLDQAGSMQVTQTSNQELSSQAYESHISNEFKPQQG